MLSLLCDARFGESDSFKEETSSYTNLESYQDYENICSNNLFDQFMVNVKNECEKNENNFDDDNNDNLLLNLKNNFSQLITIQFNDNNYNELLSLGISCLRCFVQANWLGPSSQLTPTQLIINKNENLITDSIRVFHLSDLFDIESDSFRRFQDKLRIILSLNGETILPMVKSIHLLLVIRLIFIDNIHLFEKDPVITATNDDFS
jgi:hypothetical protein